MKDRLSCCPSRRSQRCLQQSTSHQRKGIPSSFKTSRTLLSKVLSVRCQTAEQRLSLLAALLSTDSLHLVPKTISPFHSVAVAALRPSPSSLSFHPAHIQFLHNASVSLKSDSADPPLAECSSGRTLALPSAYLSTYSLSLRVATKKCQTHPRLSVSSGFGTWKCVSEPFPLL